MINKYLAAARTKKQHSSTFYKWTMTAIMITAILLAEILRYYFYFSQHNLVLIYALSVILISCISPGYFYGVAAAIVSALACDFLIIMPRFGLHISITSPLTLGTFLLITLITSRLVLRLREQQRHFEILYTINRELLSARSINAIVTLINASLAAQVKRPVIFYTADPTAQGKESYEIKTENAELESLFLDNCELEKVHHIFQEQPFGINAAISSSAGEIYYVPVFINTSVNGVIGIYCKDKILTSDEIHYVHTLAGQVALAFELQIMSDKQEMLILEAEKEKIRSTLLRSISHDFRTPLATIRGAGEAMLQHPDMPWDTRNKLLTDIKEYTEWLNRMMENILTITRLSGETLGIQKKEEIAEEVISASVSIVRKRYLHSFIKVQTPNILILVPMDATLIVQVLINLIENALKNSDPSSPVIVRLRDERTTVAFDVIDNGRGLPPELAGNPFTVPVPEKQKADSSKGIGIGLSICKTIILAHNGQITGKNRENGGAFFSFSLPKEVTTDAASKNNTRH